MAEVGDRKVAMRLVYRGDLSNTTTESIAKEKGDLKKGKGARSSRAEGVSPVACLNGNCGGLSHHQLSRGPR